MELDKEDKKWLVKKINEAVKRRSKFSDPTVALFAIISIATTAWGMKLIWGWGVSLFVGGIIFIIMTLILGSSGSVDVEDKDDGDGWN